MKEHFHDKLDGEFAEHAHRANGLANTLSFLRKHIMEEAALPEPGDRIGNRYGLARLCPTPRQTSLYIPNSQAAQDNVVLLTLH